VNHFCVYDAHTPASGRRGEPGKSCMTEKELGLDLRQPKQGETRPTSSNGILDFTAQHGI